MKKTKTVVERFRNLVTFREPKSRISESYRTLRTNLQFTSVERELKTVIVTSTAPEEGKSTTVTNLACVMAQAGYEVLLVDADMRKPTTHLFFRTPNTKGLSNLLAKQEELSSLVQPTLVEGLHLLSSGPIPPNPAELLGSWRMDEALKVMQARFDFILIDSPPVLAVTDAQVLATKADGVILVVHSGKTNREMAVKAKNQLENVNAKILGVVLNNRKSQIEDSQYYYYGE